MFFLSFILVILPMFAQETALMLACKSNSTSLDDIEKLLNSGDINEKNDTGYSAIFYLLMRDDAEKFLELFKEHGADPKTSVLDFTPLHHAASHKNPKVLQKFLDLWPDVKDIASLIPIFGASALHYAAQKKNPEGVKKLLALGVDPNITEPTHERTPIMNARDKETIRILLDAGALCCKKATNGHSGFAQIMSVDPASIAKLPFTKEYREVGALLASTLSMTVLGFFYNSIHPANK